MAAPPPAGDARADSVRLHEEGLARFLRPARRQRFIASLAQPRLRRKLGHRIPHGSDDLDPRTAQRLTAHTKHAEFVQAVTGALDDRGAPPTCYVVAPGNAHDGAELDLAAALLEFLTYGDAMISCIPGRLGLYVGEDGSPVFLLA